MKAIVYYEHGGPEVLRYEDVVDPTPGASEVLVRVAAVGINPGPDLWTRRGGFGVGAVQMPHIGGVDPAGEIVALGDDVTGFAVGDRVAVYPVLACGRCDFCRAGGDENYCRAVGMFGIGTPGGRAELVSVPTSQLVRLPDEVSCEAAAALGVAYTTTWHGLVDRGNITAADTLLVVGAGGGCGVAAVQIAHRVGARVLALTGSPAKREPLLALGADAVFDYHDEDWPQQVMSETGNGPTLAFDNGGAQTLPKTISCLNRRGRLVCSGGTTGMDVQINLSPLYRNHIDLRFYVQGSKRNMAELVALTASADLRPVIDSSFALADAAAADRRLLSDEHFGRVILTVTGSD